MFETKTRILKVGTAKLHYALIPWDSDSLNNTTVEIEFFSAKNVATLNKLLMHLQRTLHLKKGDLLFSKIPPKDFSKIQLLDQVGFYYIEQTITLDIDLSGWNPDEFVFSRGDGYRLILAGLSDKKLIRKIAGSTFIADRFHLDPNIAKAGANYRFEKWIDNSFQSTDIVYKFVDDKNLIIGFFIVNEHPDYAEFRLAGLDPKYVGRGLGKMLFHCMYRLLEDKGCTLIKSVISLNNLQVLNVYMYLGHAKFISPFIVLHKVL